MENGPHVVKEMDYDRVVRNPEEGVTLLVTQVEGSTYLSGDLTYNQHSFFSSSLCSLSQ